MRSMRVRVATRSSESEYRTTVLMALRRRGSTSGAVEFVAFSIKVITFVPFPCPPSSVPIESQSQTHCSVPSITDFEKTLIYICRDLPPFPGLACALRRRGLQSFVLMKRVVVSEVFTI